MSSTEAAESTEIPGIAEFAAFLAAKSSQVFSPDLPAGLSPEKLHRVRQALAQIDCKFHDAVIAALAVTENMPELPELLAGKPADIPKGAVVAHANGAGICEDTVNSDGKIYIAQPDRRAFYARPDACRKATAEEVMILLRGLFRL